jgi:hypothetical protein
MVILARDEDVITAVGEERLQALDREWPQTEVGKRGAKSDSNVVRLHRDWLGPRDELVPFGRSSGRPLDPASAPQPSASDFWGEHSAALQDVLQRAGDGSGSAAPVGDEAGNSLQPDSEADPTIGALQSAGRDPRWRVAVPVALVAIAAMLAFVVATGDSPRPPLTSARHSSQSRLAGQRAKGKPAQIPRKHVPQHRFASRARLHHSALRRPIHSPPAVSSGGARPASPPSAVAYQVRQPGPTAASNYGHREAAATSTPSSAPAAPASSQSEPVGPTGPAAILGPGRCSC